MDHYFTNNNLKSDIKKIKIEILGNIYHFNTDNGVFSKERLDYGTRLLIEALSKETLTGKCLDVGCGYGAISIILSKVKNIDITGIDVNKRAIHLSLMNKKENKADSTNFIESNCYEKIDGIYENIITNPPIRAGKETVYNILFGAKKHLVPKGHLYLVIRKEQGAKSIIKDLDNIYNVEILDKSKGFFVIKCILR